MHFFPPEFTTKVLTVFLSQTTLQKQKARSVESPDCHFLSEYSRFGERMCVCARAQMSSHCTWDMSFPICLLWELVWSIKKSQIQGHAAPRQRFEPESISIKVFCTPALEEKKKKEKNWLETHTAAQHRGEQVGAVAYRCSLSHSTCWSCSEESAQKDREPRHSSAETEWNMRSHSKPRGPQRLQLRALPRACEQTSSQLKTGGGGVVGWLGGIGWSIWISSFLDSKLFIPRSFPLFYNI